MEEYMKNTPIPSYDYYGELLPESSKNRRGKNQFPPHLIQSFRSKNSRSKQQRRFSLHSYSIKQEYLEETSFPHSYYVVCYFICYFFSILNSITYIS